jgi:hypothetical protein
MTNQEREYVDELGVIPNVTLGVHINECIIVDTNIPVQTAFLAIETRILKLEGVCDFTPGLGDRFHNGLIVPGRRSEGNQLAIGDGYVLI